MELTYDDLTDGQKNAFKVALNCIENRKHVTISGPGGTGKTALTKILINHLLSNGYHGIMLGAPTHQAKEVLSELSGMEANTIHSILRINPMNYEDKQVFTQSEIPDLSSCNVLICDEASMYDSKLFGIILATIPDRCVVVGIGDEYQLRPVEPNGNDQKISPFFIHSKFTQVKLTEVVRSNVPIIDVATKIRNGGWIEGHLVDGVGVHDLRTESNSVQNFMKTYFSIVKTPEDLMHTRMLAYTNKSVEQLNGIIRKRIYNTDEAFIVDEVIVLQEPLARVSRVDGKQVTEIIYNNGEMVKVLSAQETATQISITNCSTSYMIKHWKLSVIGLSKRDGSECIETIINVIVDDKETEKLNEILSDAANIFKSDRAKANWRSFWNTKRMFSKVKALPCSTIHKSQGTSVTNTFLYTACIHKADRELAQQLLYVGATRAKENLYFI